MPRVGECPVPGGGAGRGRVVQSCYPEVAPARAAIPVRRAVSRPQPCMSTHAVDADGLPTTTGAADVIGLTLSAAPVRSEAEGMAEAIVRSEAARVNRVSEVEGYHLKLSRTNKTGYMHVDVRRNGTFRIQLQRHRTDGGKKTTLDLLLPWRRHFGTQNIVLVRIL